MSWRRVGDCPPERCKGRCCTHIGTWFPKSGETEPFIDTLRVRGVEVQEIEGQYLVRFPQTCQYLTEQGLCGLHPDLNPKGLPPRPEFCERWPEEPSQLVNDPYCGFRFEWVDEPE